jgi:hypothetical protein
LNITFRLVTERSAALVWAIEQDEQAIHWLNGPFSTAMLA